MNPMNMTYVPLKEKTTGYVFVLDKLILLRDHPFKTSTNFYDF